ncbi:NDP-sugar synthase [Dehalogenimonas sp. THU2]|uniref:NDP-sugar synthase n=1 Tax=Dehalogenimonas sp. THU2 TaxID=3151121 RepID=UPI003218B254
MKALILVGGLGTRLRPLTINTPKAMMPVLNKPFMAHVVGQLMHHGVDEIILTRGHLAAQMESYFGDGSGLGIKVVYVDETRPLGTAGGIKNCERHLDETFFVLNGDVFSTIDFSAMLHSHRSKKATATIALTPVDNPSAFGLVETETDGRIRRFIEKPKPDEITTNMINAGCYLLEPEVLDFIKPDTLTSIERETFQLLLKDKQPFYSFDTTGAYWIDMGNREKYYQLNIDMLNGVCNCAGTPSPGVHLGEGTSVDPSAEISGNVVFGENCRVGANAIVTGPAVIGAGCQLGNRVSVSGSLLWPGVNIGDDSSVILSIIGDHCRIASSDHIDDSALADGVYTPPSLTLSGAAVWPGTIMSN